MTSRRILPGFALTFGWTIFYLLLIVLIPLSALILKSTTLSADEFIKAIFATRVISAFRVSFTMALYAACVNGIFGTLLAWVLVRYQFFGRQVIDALIDLPFALPTAVAGIALTALLAGNGWVGRWFEPHGIKLAFHPHGIFIALIFIGLPFVVRTVQPILEDLDKEWEEAALCLGAKPWQVFVYVIFPTLLPSVLTGFALALARGIGEYGSVVFIAGNIPMVSEIVPLIIIGKLEQYDYAGATAVAVVMLLLSFGLLWAINGLQTLQKRYVGH